MLISIVTIPAFAGNYGNVEASKINSVYDGDTFRCNIDGFPAIVGKNIKIRIKGMNTPEMKDKRKHIKALAVKAKEFAKSKLLSAKKVFRSRSSDDQLPR